MCFGRHESIDVTVVKTETAIDFHSRAVDVGNVNLIWFLHVTGVAWQKKVSSLCLLINITSGTHVPVFRGVGK